MWTARPHRVKLIPQQDHFIKQTDKSCSAGFFLLPDSFPLSFNMQTKLYQLEEKESRAWNPPRSLQWGWRGRRAMSSLIRNKPPIWLPIFSVFEGKENSQNHMVLFKSQKRLSQDPMSYFPGEKRILVLDWTLLGNELALWGPSHTHLCSHPFFGFNMCSVMGRMSTE